MLSERSLISRNSRRFSVKVGCVDIVSLRKAHSQLEHVTPEIDLSLRLQSAGYLVRVCRIASQQGEVFQEGVALYLWDYIAVMEKFVTQERPFQMEML
jgi:hypothetical protein